MRHFRKWTVAAAVAAALAAAPSAEAGFGSYGSSGGVVGHGSLGGSSGGYGVVDAGFGSSGGWGSSGGFASAGGGVGHHRRMGPLRRLHARHHARRAVHHGGWGSSGGFASHGSSGGGFASYGSSGGGFVGHGSSGGFVGHGSSGGSSGGFAVPAYSAPIYGAPIYGDPVPGEAEAAAEVGGDSVLLTVGVPEDAIVRVNGHPTTSTGPVRQFMSKGLKEGFVYKYEVEVQFAGVEEPAQRTIKVRAGQVERLVFNPPVTDAVAEASEQLETVVVVHVPADAQVELAGNETNGKGEVRTFRSRRLGEGGKWEGYTIRATAMINGVPVSKERTLDVRAGETYTVAFDFDTAEVASR